MIIAKMMKGKSEPKEELATDTKCIQCDYWTKTGITDLSCMIIIIIFYYRITI